MSETAPPTDWPARQSELRAADGDEWDRLSDAFDADWKAEYVAAFIAHALTRPGWDRANAEEWACGIVNDAMLEAAGTDVTPSVAAVRDVVECEMEAVDE